jgi:sterol desaturase/sphingolipid hydroxylase (fatty acid hydroxylase superfamily)
MSWTLSSESLIRLTAFVAVFAAIALWQAVRPFRQQEAGQVWRWLWNLGLVAVGTLFERVLVPAGAIGAAWLAAERGWGLFNVLAVPPLMAAALSIVLLDLAIYVQHVLFHAVPALWRLHMVHHVDLDFDVTTGLRFHPIERVLSMLSRIVVVTVIGAPATAVLAFEVILNATAMFNHGNVTLPTRFDRLLRWIVVTPDMHRVHHSASRTECNSNFGFNLPWWDRALGTYVEDPAAGQAGLTVGIGHVREPHQTLAWLLALPFSAGGGAYPFGRRQGS